MDKKVFLNQWTMRPIPNDPIVKAQKEAWLCQVVDVEKRKAKAIKRRGRWQDRSACNQSEFGFLADALPRSQSVVVCNGKD